jgi:hypothetical protein
MVGTTVVSASCANLNEPQITFAVLDFVFDDARGGSGSL